MAASTPTTLERPVEQELAPGIFFTAAPKRTPPSSAVPGGGEGNGMPAAPDVEKMTREELEWEYRTIGKTIAKLRESNQLMAEFDKAEKKDKVLTDAIAENADIIARRSDRLIIVKERLDYLIRSNPEVKPCRPEELKNKLASTILESGTTSAIAAAAADEEAAAVSGDAIGGLNINENTAEQVGTTTTTDVEEPLGMDL